MEQKKIGTSLSLCVQDIMENTIDEDDVLFIVSRTKCETEEQWKSLIEMYCNSYWRKNPKRAKEIVYNLTASNKIFQPRIVVHPRLYPTGNKRWVDDMADIQWSSLI